METVKIDVDVFLKELPSVDIKKLGVEELAVYVIKIEACLTLLYHIKEPTMVDRSMIDAYLYYMERFQRAKLNDTITKLLHIYKKDKDTVLSELQELSFVSLSRLNSILEEEKAANPNWEALHKIVKEEYDQRVILLSN